jgi:hypothetical protein
MHRPVLDEGLLRFNEADAVRALAGQRLVCLVRIVLPEAHGAQLIGTAFGERSVAAARARLKIRHERDVLTYAVGPSRCEGCARRGSCGPHASRSVHLVHADHFDCDLEANTGRMRMIKTAALSERSGPLGDQRGQSEWPLLSVTRPCEVLHSL